MKKSIFPTAKSIFLVALSILLLAMALVGCNSKNSPPSKPDITPTVGSAGLTYKLDDSGEFAICTGIGTADTTDIVISSHFEGVVVEEIASSAFNGNNYIKTLRIPDGIKVIKQKAFFKCSALKIVEISSTVTEIGTQAFRNCTSLISVSVDDNNDLTKIGLNAFADCSSLTSVILGNNSSLTTISGYAFNSCKKMTTFELGRNSKLKEIGEFCFQYADGLSKFFIPKSVERIGGYALGGIGFDEGNGFQSTWIYVEAKSSGTLWDGFWNSSNAHVVYERSYDDYLLNNKD